MFGCWAGLRIIPINAKWHHTLVCVIICVEVKFMPTNLAIDDDLLKLALEIGKLRTKKETVNQALKEFIEKRKQKEIIQLFGKFDPDPDYDYKSGR